MRQWSAAHGLDDQSNLDNNDPRKPIVDAACHLRFRRSRPAAFRNAAISLLRLAGRKEMPSPSAIFAITPQTPQKIPVHCEKLIGPTSGVGCWAILPTTLLLIVLGWNATIRPHFLYPNRPQGLSNHS